MDAKIKRGPFAMTLDIVRICPDEVGACAKVMKDTLQVQSDPETPGPDRGPFSGVFA